MDAALLLQLDELEDEYEQDEQRLQRLLSVLIAGVHEHEILRQQRARGNRNYLVRGDLLPNPRFATAWQALLAAGNDKAFINTMSIDVETFHHILNSGFRHYWNSYAVPRTDVERTAAPRVDRRSLDAEGGLGLILHWLCSTMREKTLAQLFALVPSTVSRYINFANQILCFTLAVVADAGIRWPQTLDEFIELTRLVVRRHGNLWGAFGTVDGLKTPVGDSSDPRWQNATYNGWLHDTFVSSVLAFSSKGPVIACVLNAPGSWSDSWISRPIFEKLLQNTPEEFFLVGDTAFPKVAEHLMPRFQCPMKAGEVVRGTVQEIEAIRKHDQQLLSYRQGAEWGMRDIQGPFGRLRLPMDPNDHQGRERTLSNCVRLTNLRARRVGISQIKNVYDPIWKEDAEEAAMWDGFRDMLFGDVVHRDRVSRFHLRLLEN